MSKINSASTGTFSIFAYSHNIIVTNKIRIILHNFTKYFNKYILLILAFLITTIPVNSKVFFLEADYYQDKTQERNLVLGKGEIISSDTAVTRVAISDPNIIDLQVLNEKQIFIRAKRLGISTFLAWEKDKKTPSRFDISVWPDIAYLTKQLHELDENIIVEYIPPATNSGSGESQSQDESQGSGGSQGGGSGSNSASPMGQAGGALSTAGSNNSSSSSSQSTSGKIILKGAVKNAEIIARALQVAGAYVGDQGIKIISQPGGQIVDGLAGQYNLFNNSDTQTTGGSSQSGGSAISFGGRDSIHFTSNRYANLSRGVIATTQKGSVLSFLTVKDPPQISVAIRFYEISRTLARDIGFNTIIGGHNLQGATSVGGDALSSINGLALSTNNISEFMGGSSQSPPDFMLGASSTPANFLMQTLGQGITGVVFNPNNGIGAILQALQKKGEVKVLAEPTLVIANGEPASFLAGGEVPIVRSIITASGAGQDISYEPFGIRFSILPIVTGENRIYLQLIPELRDIDNALSDFVTSMGTTSLKPPAFKTKRTQTQVELESGQAFAISGLLKEENARNLRKIPGIGDIPILGSLFRSKSFSKGQSELLIVVSPEIVRPTSPDKIAKKLSVPEEPYKEFNQYVPFKKDVKPGDEQGPNLEKPLDAGKYHTPEDNPEKSMEIKKQEELISFKKEIDSLEIEKLNKEKELAEVKQELDKKAQEVRNKEPKKLKSKFTTNFFNRKTNPVREKEKEKELKYTYKASQLSKEMENLVNTYELSKKQRLEAYRKSKIN